MQEVMVEKTDKISIDELLNRVYKPGFFGVARWVSGNGGTFEDARDVFHDAVLVLYDDLSNGKPVINEEAYLMGVAKNLWVNRIKSALRQTELSKCTAETLPVETTPDQHRLLSLLQQAGKKCLELLSAFYFEGQRPWEMVSRFGFSSEHSASVQKYKCIEKLRETVRTKMITYEDFLE